MGSSIQVTDSNVIRPYSNGQERATDQSWLLIARKNVCKPCSESVASILDNGDAIRHVAHASRCRQLKKNLYRHDFARIHSTGLLITSFRMYRATMHVDCLDFMKIST